MIQCLRIQRKKSPCFFSFKTDRSVFTFTKYPPVTLSPEHSVAVILFILFHKHPAHACPMTVPSVKEEVLKDCQHIQLWTLSGKPRQRTQFSYNGQRYLHSTVPSNHQIQKFLVLTLALLEASGNHWSFLNNWRYYLTGHWSHLAKVYIWSYPFSCPFYPILWGRILKWVLIPLTKFNNVFQTKCQNFLLIVLLLLFL